MSRYRTYRKRLNLTLTKRPHIRRKRQTIGLSGTFLKNAKLYDGMVKEFFSIERLIEELEAKLTFSGDEKIIAENFFKDINYYRFSIYPKLLPKREDEKKYSFTDALDLYYFDEFLKSYLYEFTSYLENKWKGSLVTYLGNHYDNDEFFMAQCYLDLSLYQSEEWGRSIISQIEYRIKESNSSPIQHHHQNKNDYIPLWVLVEELTFGEFETFLTQLDKSRLRDYVRYVYQDPKYPGAFNGWIALIRLLRNKISHHSRLYGANFTKTPRIVGRDAKMFFQNVGTNSKLRHQLVASFYVLHKLFLFENSRIISQWNTFLVNLEKEIQKLDSVLNVEKYLGFPENWKELLTIHS
ncbi:Abi family protein [Bacillus mycoides]|uniref:Abi family protein n=1 Tax=Bacillus mycoides TaxID=1405 RepID=UPI001482085D|nr:Abi family protein [Bacillus mycoides]